MNKLKHFQFTHLVLCRVPIFFDVKKTSVRLFSFQFAGNLSSLLYLRVFAFHLWHFRAISPPISEMSSPSSSSDGKRIPKKEGAILLFADALVQFVHTELAIDLLPLPLLLLLCRTNRALAQACRDKRAAIARCIEKERLPNGILNGCIRAGEEMPQEWRDACQWALQRNLELRYVLNGRRRLQSEAGGDATAALPQVVQLLKEGAYGSVFEELALDFHLPDDRPYLEALLQ